MNPLAITDLRVSGWMDEPLSDSFCHSYTIAFVKRLRELLGRCSFPRPPIEMWLTLATVLVLYERGFRDRLVSCAPDQQFLSIVKKCLGTPEHFIV